VGAQVGAAGLKLMIVQSLSLPLRLSQRSVDDSHAAGQAPVAAGDVPVAGGHAPIAGGHASIGEDEDPIGTPGGPALDRRALRCEEGVQVLTMYYTVVWSCCNWLLSCWFYSSTSAWFLSPSPHLHGSWDFVASFRLYGSYDLVHSQGFSYQLLLVVGVT
jgi:hypothetical protein